MSFCQHFHYSSDHLPQPYMRLSLKKQRLVLPFSAFASQSLSCVIAWCQQWWGIHHIFPCGPDENLRDGKLLGNISSAFLVSAPGPTIPMHHPPCDPHLAQSDGCDDPWEMTDQIICRASELAGSFSGRTFLLGMCDSCECHLSYYFHYWSAYVSFVRKVSHRTNDGM